MLIVVEFIAMVFKIQTITNDKHLFSLGDFGRSERIRTSDPLTPSQVRYLAALRSDHLKALEYKGFIGKSIAASKRT